LEKRGKCTYSESAVARLSSSQAIFLPISMKGCIGIHHGTDRMRSEERCESGYLVAALIGCSLDGP
jgi:hypothetical protein